MDTMILHTMNSFHSYGLGCHNQLGYAYLIRYIEKLTGENMVFSTSELMQKYSNYADAK